MSHSVLYEIKKRKDSPLPSTCIHTAQQKKRTRVKKTLLQPPLTISPLSFVTETEAEKALLPVPPQAIAALRPSPHPSRWRMWRSDPLHTPPCPISNGIRGGLPLPFPPCNNPPASRSSDSGPIEVVGGGSPAKWMRGPVLEGCGSDAISEMQKLLLGLQPRSHEKWHDMVLRPGVREKRCGTWWSLAGGYPVQEGVDFVQDSQGEIDDDYLFVLDSRSDEEEVVDRDACEVGDDDFVPDSQPEDPDSVEKIGVGEDQMRGHVAMPNPSGGPHCQQRFFTNSVFKSLLKDLAQEEKARRDYFGKSARQEEDDKATRKKDDRATREHKSLKASDDDEKERASGDDKGNRHFVGLDWRGHGQMDDSELW